MTKDEAKPHILLVEDARDIREPLARYLREHGYRATTAPDAASARRVMKSSAIDLMVNLGGNVTTAGLNALMMEAANASPGLAGYSDNPHASVDFNHNPCSFIIDGSQTRVNGSRFTNLFVWFDNEWGFVNRMLDAAAAWSAKLPAGAQTHAR